MRVDIKIPSVGESITEVEIGEWLKKPGDPVAKNESLLLLETDKATMEVYAPESGTLVDVLKKNGESAAIGEIIGRLETQSNGASATATEAGPQEESPRTAESPGLTPPPDKTIPRMSAEPLGPETSPDQTKPATHDGPAEREIEIIGAKERTAQQLRDAEPVHDESQSAEPRRKAPASADEGVTTRPAAKAERRDEVVPMTLLRRRIAERLVAAQQGAALLTTFNEIDMSAVMQLRKAQGEEFRQKHGIKLGLMSFFVKATVSALQTFREVNADIDGESIVYHNYYDIGVAVGGGKGLVVPVLRDADHMSFADIERAIDDFAGRARDSRLKPEELQGGTFTITNGGVYGSLLSTPIVNPPQSAILGLHAIQERPVARNGRVMARPMMYVALSYDHRIIDGREAVLFLKQIKTMVEQPARILLAC
jgi:2-oxoglutarate dehydrogenase E2 component (dihydrolipoamide succinyltransferase)